MEIFNFHVCPICSRSLKNLTDVLQLIPNFHFNINFYYKQEYVFAFGIQFLIYNYKVIPLQIFFRKNGPKSDPSFILEVIKMSVLIGLNMKTGTEYQIIKCPAHKNSLPIICSYEMKLR